MGIAEVMTMNSALLLVILSIVTDCRLSFVTTTVPAGLFVFTSTEPKFSEVGEGSTCAWSGKGKNRQPTKSNPRDKHTSSVLSMRGNPS